MDGDREYFEEVNKNEGRYALGRNTHARAVRAQCETLHGEVQIFEKLGKGLVCLVLPFRGLLSVSVN